MIHVLIPTYLQRGYGPQYLSRLLASLQAQKGVDFHVWISDNDNTGAIKKVVDKYHFDRLTYEYNPVCGASENINNVIRMVEEVYLEISLSTVINAPKMKLMCMDDLFMQPDALFLFYDALQHSGPHGWVISNSVVINSRDAIKKNVTARFEKYIFSKNTVGMPSCIAWKHTLGLRFDPNLKTFCDTDFYHQLYRLYGDPIHNQKYLIGQRYHPHSQSRNQQGTHERDAAILKQRYGL